MTWPFDRLFSYITGSPVRAADLNALQDAIIHDRGERALMLAASPLAGLDEDPGTGSWVINLASYTTLMGNYVGTLRIPLRVGDRIKGYKVFGHKGATIGRVWTSKISILNMTDGSERHSAGNTEPGAAANWASTSETGLSLTLGANESAVVQINSGVSASAVGASIYGVEVTFDHP